MEETFREKLLRMKREEQIAYVNFFNNGEIEMDKYKYAERIETFSNDESIENIKDVLDRASKTYMYHGDYDFIRMNLMLGLVYKKEDVTDDNKIKFGKLPVDGIVRYYTGDINSYLKGKQTNNYQYNDLGKGRQGYLYYNDFAEKISKEGIYFDGPYTYERFIELMSSHIPFDLHLAVSLEEDKKLTRKL